jgi:trimeric autotransporter adhesin
MKKLILTSALLIVCQYSKAQWLGATTAATGYIYRTGNVALGAGAIATATTIPFAVNASTTAGTKIAFGANTMKGTYTATTISALDIQANFATAAEAHLNLSAGTSTTAIAVDLVSNRNLGYNGIVNSGALVPFTIQNGGAERLRLTSDGLLGVGNSAPKAKLQIGQGLRSVSMGDYPYTAGFMNTYLGFNAARNATGAWTMEAGVNNNGGSVIVNDIAGNLSFVTFPNAAATNTLPQTKTDADVFAARRMTISNTGKVIIGENIANLPGTYKLYVQEGILTEKVKIALRTSLQWADFVFDKDYHLKSLTEVEKYINDNHHLENIPSTKEVLANGVDLLEINAKLLQKVEELTLYNIELNKQNKAMDERLKIIEAKFNSDKK